MKKGMFYTIIAGIAWGLSGTSGQYLLSHGFESLVLTDIRLLIAGGILTSMAYLSNQDKFFSLFKDKQALFAIFVFALFGLVLNQFAYLVAIKETNAGTATVLQYVCPVGVLSYTCIKEKMAPTMTEVLSMVCAVGGTFLIATHGRIDQLSMTPTGLFWGLFSALTYGLYIILPAKLIQEWGSMLVIGVGMLMGGILIAPFSGLSQHVWVWNLDIFLALIGIIGVGTVLAYTLFLKGASIIGAVKSSLVASIEPISAVFFASLLMGESFHSLDFLGMLFILLGVLLISVKDIIKTQHNSIL